ncbi:MAG TPA: hypothetical protein VKT77_07760 [Chthonomonadaceae bacterium]|nr:hypothetical protein [Chthonomonadaceae bacterium]
MPEPSRIARNLREVDTSDETDQSGPGGAGYDRVQFEGHEVDLNELAELVYRIARDQIRFDALRSGERR